MYQFLAGCLILRNQLHAQNPRQLRRYVAGLLDADDRSLQIFCVNLHPGEVGAPKIHVIKFRFVKNGFTQVASIEANIFKDALAKVDIFQSAVFKNNASERRRLHLNQVALTVVKSTIAKL